MNKKNKKELKLQAETLIRKQSVYGARGNIVWRDNRWQTYQQVLDYLIKNPNLGLE